MKAETDKGIGFTDVVDRLYTLERYVLPKVRREDALHVLDTGRIPGTVDVWEAIRILADAVHILFENSEKHGTREAQTMAEHEVTVDVTLTGADAALEKLEKIKALFASARTQVHELADALDSLDVEMHSN